MTENQKTADWSERKNNEYSLKFVARGGGGA